MCRIMPTLTEALQQSRGAGGRSARCVLQGHVWLVRWDEDGGYTLLWVPPPDQPAALQSWRFPHLPALLRFALRQPWPAAPVESWEAVR